MISSESEVQTQQELKKHHELCQALPKKSSVTDKNLNCGKCDFSSKKEGKLKRHERDEHDILTASTSPKPKKKKSGGIEEELMEVDSNSEEEQKDEEKSMEIDEHEDVVIERSKNWDKKITSWG